MKRIILFLNVLLALTVVSFGQTTKTVGGSGANYSTLKLAFDAINAGNITGVIVLQIIENSSEPTGATLNSSGTGSANYSSVRIYPTVSGITISGNIAGPLVLYNGADNVTFDGRVNGTGSSADMVINNTNNGSSASTLKFYGSAENNTVKYCYIKGAATSAGTGVVYFANSSTGNGNSGNIIDNNYITCSSDGNRPINTIYSSGTSAHENSSVTISNNYFYNFFSPSNNSYCINITSASIGWNISGNHFYETTSFVPTGGHNYNVIRISTSNLHTESNNNIGGSTSSCGGAAWTVNASLPHYWCGIYAFAGSTTATKVTISNNIIRNINYTSTQSNPWDGIYISSGFMDVTGNTIGSTTGTGSILINTPAASASATISGGLVTGITMNGGGTGYTIAPLITFSTSGSTTSATAHAIISGGSVTSIILDGGGTGYTSAPNVIIDGSTYSTSHGIRNFSTGVINISNNNIGSITTSGSTTYSH
ncbi:MAG: hypothetical protein WCL00_04370, partial [Bacteroidota bacterium]